MNAAQVARLEAIGNAILSAASLVNPAAGAVTKALEGVIVADKLFAAGAEFTDLLSEIRAETDATAEQVGADVSASYAANRDKLLASIAAHPGR